MPMTPATQFRYSLVIVLLLTGLVAVLASFVPRAVAQFAVPSSAPMPALPEEIHLLPWATADIVLKPFPTPPPRYVSSPPTPGDGQAGIDFGPTQPAKNAKGYYGGHQAHLTLQLPPVPSGVAYLYAPTAMNSGNCLETVTAYFRAAGQASTLREVWTWDHCVAHGVVARITIDDTFFQRYMYEVQTPHLFFTEVIQESKTTYTSLLFRKDIGSWEVMYSLTTTNKPLVPGGGRSMRTTSSTPTQAAHH